MDSSPLRAFMVAVDYSDLLPITLNYNLHHFNEVTIVTDPNSKEAVVNIVWNELPNPTKTGINVLTTNAFYYGGAKFNKWLALEWGLDQMGRDGWICLMDADVCWPKDVKVSVFGESVRFGWHKGDTIVNRGQLFTPLRRMVDDLAPLRSVDGVFTVPDESMWSNYHIHRNIHEWAGYSQVFWGEDDALKLCANCGHVAGDHTQEHVCRRYAWHETDWLHAGGADSFFQRRWQPESKIRPAWEVLHLGPAGVNWMGRSSEYVDGTRHPQGQQRHGQIMQMWSARRAREVKIRQGTLPRHKLFDAEKVDKEG